MVIPAEARKELDIKARQEKINRLKSQMLSSTTNKEYQAFLKEVSLEEVHHRARLFQLVKELPDDQQRVITMRFAEQRSTNEVGHALGRSDGAVKQLQFRALQNLRTRMGKMNG